MLKQLRIEGFKSIREMDLELSSLNVLIGANGAGKSNLISFFKLINEMMAGRLQDYIGRAGQAQSILHFGSKVSPQVQAKLEFLLESGTDTYEIRLFHAASDTLIFAEETLSFLGENYDSPRIDGLGAGHKESLLKQFSYGDDGLPTAKTLKYLLDRCRFYHFHDTSIDAGVRQSSYVEDKRFLMPSAENLPSMLLRFREENHTVYARIVRTIQTIVPFFDDFDLVENSYNSRVILNWREQGSDHIMGPHQLSDGTLRVICLITLLLQPEEEFPQLIVVDEPELGLHPSALRIVAELFQAAATQTQILISTQSSTFIDHFYPEDIIVVDRILDNSKFSRWESQFKRLDAEDLKSWLEEYSLGEIWEKNIVGGGPL
ncbi:MAG: AAA family ATPase [Spirulinaceae cyanobacterium]